MNLSKTHKKIKRGILLFIVLSLFMYIPNVNAAIKYCKKAGLDENEEIETASDILINRYKINLEELGNKKYRLSMKPANKNNCVTLHLVKLNGTSVDHTFTCDKPYEFTSDTTNKTQSGLEGIIVKIMGYDIPKSTKDNDTCYYSKASATLEVTGKPQITKHDDTCPTVTLEVANYSNSEIDCSKSGLNAFQQEFCKAKRLATVKKTVSGDNLDADVNSDTFGKFKSSYGGISGGTLKCDPDLTNFTKNPLDSYKEVRPTGTYKDSSTSYFSQKDYLYASVSKTYDMGNYEYNYAVGKCTVGAKITCKVKCEEAVEVEYGPPVASFAGMCFEYKFRVTSRVACSIEGPPKPPEPNCYHKEPAPVCVSSNGSVWRQGGPNEDFDACIKACDGGSYSSACSNKCYNEVYGKSVNTGAQVSTALYKEVQATQLAKKKNKKKTVACADSISLSECKSITGQHGCYAVSGGSIVWKGGGAGRWYSLGRWSPCNPANEYVPDSIGIYRHVNGDGSLCNDTCYWTGPTNEYINPGVSKVDYKNNVKKYNAAVKACRNMASCSTTSAEFSITAEYTKKGSSTVTSIKFPYNSSNDHLRHVDSRNVDTTQNNSITTLRPDFGGEGAGIKGCYRAGSTESTLYRSTWGFPGAWKNMKTNEISYKKITGSSAWKSFPENFCIPNDAKDVNANWFFAYYNRLIAKGIVNVPGLDPTSKYSTIKYTNKESYTSSLKYNIKAQTTKFGYFDWTINIHCFFAIGTDPGDNPPGDGLNYVIRSVDQKDLFPNKDGSNHNVNEAGREPEYNWSDRATNTKNSGYTSQPKTYMKAIQNYAKNHANDLYNDSNLDYEFYLSPETLRSIRKDNFGSGGSNYTAFKDSAFYLDENGVGRYYSDFARSLGSARDRKVPQKRALRCNNMRNYLSTDCCVNWDAQGNCIAG